MKRLSVFLLCLLGGGPIWGLDSALRGTRCIVPGRHLECEEEKRNGIVVSRGSWTI